jgi:hypothetical protein
LFSSWRRLVAGGYAQYVPESGGFRPCLHRVCALLRKHDTLTWTLRNCYRVTIPGNVAPRGTTLRCRSIRPLVSISESCDVLLGACLQRDPQ